MLVSILGRPQAAKRGLGRVWDIGNSLFFRLSAQALVCVNLSKYRVSKRNPFHRSVTG